MAEVVVERPEASGKIVTGIAETRLPDVDKASQPSTGKRPASHTSRSRSARSAAARLTYRTFDPALTRQTVPAQLSHANSVSKL